MLIKLTDLPAYYINLEAEKEKNESTYKLLRSLGFSNVIRTPGFLAENHIVGCGLAHQNALISRQSYDKPFLLFEDDIESAYFQTSIEIPDNADAVYLGVSKMGMVDGESVEKIIVSKVDGYKDIFKIHNMLAAHAILYLNPEYIKQITSKIEDFLRRKIPHDIVLAECMGDWNIYAFNSPMFIQSKKFRDYTDKNISDLKELVIL